MCHTARDAARSAGPRQNPVVGQRWGWQWQALTLTQDTHAGWAKPITLWDTSQGGCQAICVPPSVAAITEQHQVPHSMPPAPPALLVLDSWLRLQALMQPSGHPGGVCIIAKLCCSTAAGWWWLQRTLLLLLLLLPLLHRLLVLRPRRRVDCQRGSGRTRRGLLSGGTLL